MLETPKAQNMLNSSLEIIDSQTITMLRQKLKLAKLISYKVNTVKMKFSW